MCVLFYWAYKGSLSLVQKKYLQIGNIENHLELKFQNITFWSIGLSHK